MKNSQKQSLLGTLASHQEITILIVTVALIAVLTAIAPAFMSAGNIFSLMITLSFVGIVAVGEGLIMLTGDFDISVGSVAAMGAVISTMFMVETNCFGMAETGAEWVGVWLSILLAMICCSCIGLLNAFLIIKIRLAPFVTTIATYYIAKSIANMMSNGVPVYPLPETANKIGGTKLALTSDGNGISYVFIVFVVLIIVFEIILRKTSYGRAIYAIGSNREVAKISGINVNLVRGSTFVITSMLAGLAGAMVAMYMGQGYAATGNMWELLIISSVVIGGISTNGGRGSMFAVFIGIILIHVMSTGLVMLNLNTFLSYVFQGLMIIVAVLIDHYTRSRKIRSLV